MVFTSIHYLFFFPVVAFLYYALPYRFRWIWLLVASYYFYMCWKPEYAVLLLLTTMVDYFCALQMGKSSSLRARRGFLMLSLASNLGMLFFFKYFNFFNNGIYQIAQQLNIFYAIPQLKVLLPVGISFYVFQSIGYTIDVYRGTREPEKHPGIFAVYVVFFPQLVAGPIERSGRLLPQFYEQHDFDYQRAVDGLKLALWGFFKKLVIADRLAIIVDPVYNSPHSFDGLSLVVATWLFAFQLFCDFSGYCDIAIGSAQILGFRLINNFNRPYFAKSISEFWRRWHISLSTWFRDYLYIPLGGNRTSKHRWYFNIFIVFMVSGLWHGANWTFLIWGCIHGFYMVAESATQGVRERVMSFLHLPEDTLGGKLIRIAVTFNLVAFAWIFFRANSVEDAFYIATHLFNSQGASIFDGSTVRLNEIIIATAGILVMETLHLLQRNMSLLAFVRARPAPLRWCIYYGAVTLVLVFAKTGSKAFIYFQF